MTTRHDLTTGISQRMLLGLLCALLSGSTVAADPKPLTKEEQAKVDQAIDKAVAKLKRKQTRQGDWPRNTPWLGKYLVGQCTFPAYALLESGVPADDPVIQRAADFIRPKLGWLEETYEVSLAALFLDRLGNPKDKKLIQSLALRLIAGQHRSGGWNYRCPILSAENEAILLKLLAELDKRMAGGKSNAEVLKALEVPRALKPLTVFQDPRLLWTEPSCQFPGATRMFFEGLPDNSNTQFAMLALWAARRHDVPLEPTFRILVERFERSQRADGWWPYATGLGRPTRSMICVGLLGLAIGRGLKLPTPGKIQRGEADIRVLMGLAALYQEIGMPTAQMKKTVPLQDYYFLWSVERVAMLYNLPTIGDREWFRWGAEMLITNQERGGEWLRNATPGAKDFITVRYGPVLNTSFSLLFLKHSHPMKELTPKLPFTATELNQGIARLREGDNRGIGRLRENDPLLRGTKSRSRERSNPKPEKNRSGP